MSDGNRGMSGVLIIAERDPHVGLFIPVLIDSDACGESDVAKVAISVVPIQIIPPSIIGQEKAEVSISLEVGPNGRQSKRIGRIAYPRLPRYIRECAIAVIAVKS